MIILNNQGVSLRKRLEADTIKIHSAKGLISPFALFFQLYSFSC